MNRTGTLDAQDVAMPESVVHRWQVAGASVRGALHVREGIANQDAFATWTSDDAAAPVAIVTVADGHGGARHFRSAIGARLAVDKGLEVLREMASRFDAASDAERARITAVDVPLRIVKTWTDAAHAHLAAHPIGDDEWLALQVADGPDALEMVRAEPLFAYGATLLAALVTRRCIVLVQLGDGDILVVDADGKAVRPVPSDARLVGHLTTSLCRTEAARDFRSAVLPLGRGDAPLLMLSTDGYANSFKDDGHFLRLSRTVLESIRTNGIDAFGGQMPAILDHASTHGSGDDVTLALLYRAAGDARDAQSEAAPLDSADRLAEPTKDRVRSLTLALTIALLVVAAAIGLSALG